MSLVHYRPEQPAAPSSIWRRSSRAYIGAMPETIVGFAIAAAFGLVDRLEFVTLSPVTAGLMLIPAVIAWRAVKVMPDGDEELYLQSNILPHLKEGLRGIAIAAVFVCAWCISAAIMLGSIGMMIVALRKLL